MASAMPYTYFRCPCATRDRRFTTPLASAAPPRPSDSGSDSKPTAKPAGSATALASSHSSSSSSEDERSSDDEETPLDPRSPRSNFSLFPLEYLLYCNNCHDIRCPRCVTDEIVAYFCPNCLFEVPSSNLRSEGNRCTRSCFQCPICAAPLAVTPLGPAPDLLAPPDPLSSASANTAPSTPGPHALICTYCRWSSTEVGLRFDKPNAVYSQLARTLNGGCARPLLRSSRDRRRATASPSDYSQSQAQPQHLPFSSSDLDPDLHFAALRDFYHSQLARLDPTSASVAAASAAFADPTISSPAQLSRLMSLYAGRSAATRPSPSLRAPSHAPSPLVREANSTDEGLKLSQLDESAAVTRLLQSSWHDTTSADQSARQMRPARFIGDLRPVPCLLRSKRARRCPACRHIICKPESKPSNSRFRIRLVAASYLPTIEIRQLSPATPSGSAVAAVVAPGLPVQYVLTFRNPIFERVRVSLAAPAETPGSFPSTVTVLCPQFEMDANSDDWDDVLKNNPASGEEGTLHQVEVGKTWDRGRNWVSVVLEVVPARSLAADSRRDRRMNIPPRVPGSYTPTNGLDDHGHVPLAEDEYLLEVPILIRLEWDADPAPYDAGSSVKEKEVKIRRDLAYWCVLGLGRIDST